MTMRRFLHAFACLSALLATSSAARTPNPNAVAITDVTVIDVEQGRAAGPRTVVVRDGRILAVSKPRDARIPSKALRISGRGRYLIPGLVDMHVHLFNLSSHRAPNDWTFPLFVANGVTGVRDMNADADALALVRQWRRRIDAGDLLAPHILATGIAVYGTSPEEATRQVDAAVAAGADFIKIFSEVPATHWRAIMAQARSRALPVAGHVPSGVTLLAAARAGQRTDEHLTQAVEACSSLEASLMRARVGLDSDALQTLRDSQEKTALDTYDDAICAKVAAELASTGQAEVPTQILLYEESIRHPHAPSEDPRWTYLRPDERARWTRILAGLPGEGDALARERWEMAKRIVGVFHRAGVPVLAGTDTPMPNNYPGFSLHEELELLVESGLSPMQALQAATFAPAQFFGSDSTTGSIAPGKRADLVLLDADPTRDIRNTRRIRAVLIDGRPLQRPELDAVLEAAAIAQQH